MQHQLHLSIITQDQAQSKDLDVVDWACGSRIMPNIYDACIHIYEIIVGLTWTRKDIIRIMKNNGG
jgi:hypothetical protein